MNTAGLFLFLILGAIAMIQNIGAGLALWGVGYVFGRRISATDEDQFVGVLMVLAGLGTVIPTVLELVRRLTAAP